MAVHYSVKTIVWETPQDFFDALDKEFGFDVDVCALPENTKCVRFFSPADDGLKQVWKGVCWMKRCRHVPVPRGNALNILAGYVVCSKCGRKGMYSRGQRKFGRPKRIIWWREFDL